MAFTRTSLNNIAGSMGLRNFWIHSDSSNTLATLKAANYFANAQEDGVRVGDMIALCGSDGFGLGHFTVISATASTIVGITAL